MPSKAAKTPTKKTGKSSTPSKSKTSAPKKSVTQTRSSAKTSTKRETVTTLAQSLKSLETRLKGADTKNRKAIKALETVVSEIKVAAKRSSTTHKAALTRGLNQVELRMETYLERTAAQARANVRTELASVTAAGSDLSTLENAVQSAHGRLDQMDQLHREALARLNRHVADLAVSMDNRLKSETEARIESEAALDAKIQSVRTHVDQRVDQVETETATALEAVGEKVAEFAAVLDKRAETSDAQTAERLADLAKEAQSGMMAAQNDVEARLEALEVIASAWSPQETVAAPMANPYLPANEDDPRIDQMGETIASLQEELRRMHTRIASVQSAAQNGTPQAAAPSAANILPMVAAPSLSQAQTQDFSPDNPYAAAAKSFEASAVEIAKPNVIEPAKIQNPPARESHIPQEFDPTAFTPQAQSNNPMPVVTQGPQTAAPLPQSTLPQPSTLAPIAPPHLTAAPIAPPPIAPPPLSNSGSHTPIAQNLPEIGPEESLMQAPAPVVTYADPAYAEGDEMRAERIGEVGARRSNRPKLNIPKLPISSRNLRVGGLAVGVAVVGLFAAKSILGGPGSTGLETDVNDFQNVSINTPSNGLTPQGKNLGRDLGTPAATSGQSASLQTPTVQAPNSQIGTPPPPSVPTGQYAETKPITLSAGAVDTLDAAVEAGDPIAQFQKGLAQLQAGQMEEGARLIRLSANRNQPAAQYRLAKLYETGTGLAKDEITARELIERAARGGNRIAMHDLGNYHAYGQGGLEQNIGVALDWFTRAAERGVVDSQFNVAFLREGNEGIPADIETAYFWYQIAARQGDQGAPDRIAILDAQLDPDTQAQIKSRADNFKPKPVDEAANGVFRNVSWGKPKHDTAQAKSVEILKIRDAQTLLGQLGYPVGKPDGIPGSKTRDAIKSFEAVNGLPETGQITDELIERLEIATGA